MVSPEQARSQARRRLVAAHRRWTLGGWSAPAWTLPLHPPTERQVLADPGGAERWARSWGAASLPAGLRLDWEDRSWRSVGTQRVPVRLAAGTPEDLAGFVGGQEARAQRTFAERVGRIRTLAGSGSGTLAGRGTEMSKTTEAAGSGDLAAVLSRFADRITSLPQSEFDRLIEVTRWLGTHPVAGLRPRQLPIRGVDSKWFSTHRTLLTALHGALYAPPRAEHVDGDLSVGGDVAGAGSPEAGAGAGLGVLDADPRIRMRILDPSMRPAGLTDLQVPVSEAAALPWRPDRVVIVENLETLLCLPDALRVVAVWGRGFDTAAALLPWLRGVPILYWGDLDSHGFAILHRYRSHLPQIESLLMDEGTLEAFADLWVPEPKPFRGSLPTLTPSESRALERLGTEGGVRLEQERIPWAHALERLAPHLPHPRNLEVDG